nr:ABC transporter ATP-binding protein [uncultured bacterium]
MTAVIECAGLVKRYGEVVALDDVGLWVEEGSVLGLLGPNGAGKTTTVRVLSTLLRPDEGWARVGGYDVLRQPQQVRRLLGLSGQYAAVDQYLTGRENLVLFGRLHRLRRQAALRRADELIDRFDLGEAAGRLVRTYSGGMRRRLDLAASLIARPRVIAMDEPTTGLDPRSRLTTWELVGELVEQGTTVLLTTQYLEEADRIADRIVVVDAGRVIADDTAAELKRRTGGDRIELTLADRSGQGAASAVLAAIGDGDPVVDDRRLSVPVSTGMRALATVAGALAERGLAVADLGLRQPTLDDVFLTITGHRAPVPEEVPA